MKFNKNAFINKVNAHIKDVSAGGFLAEATPLEEALYYSLHYNTLLEDDDKISLADVEREIKHLDIYAAIEMIMAYKNGYVEESTYARELISARFMSRRVFQDAIDMLRRPCADHPLSLAEEIDMREAFDL